MNHIIITSPVGDQYCGVCGSLNLAEQPVCTGARPARFEEHKYIRVPTTGAKLITEERLRQQRSKEQGGEGFRLEDDAAYGQQELLKAAWSYVVETLGGRGLNSWPWSNVWFKPRTDIKNLVKAGALIAAEIDRLQEAEYEAAQKAK